MNAVLGPRPRKGASALCCFMRPVVGLRERPGFGALFLLALAPNGRGQFAIANLRSTEGDCHFPNCLSSLLLIIHDKEHAMTNGIGHTQPKTKPPVSKKPQGKDDKRKSKGKAPAQSSKE